MSEEAKDIRKLMEDAELNIEADDLKEAGEKLRQAIQKAKNIENEELLNRIFEFVQEFTYSTKTQSIKLSPIVTDELILDIGNEEKV